jgi:NAD(P)-dependent dehydrogenase (short-subunit alcohol dehydrogenase family)
VTLRWKTAFVAHVEFAENGGKVAVHYRQKEDQAGAKLEELRARGSDGSVMQAGVSKQEEIHRIFARVKSEFASPDTKRSPWFFLIRPKPIPASAGGNLELRTSAARGAEVRGQNIRRRAE